MLKQRHVTLQRGQNVCKCCERKCLIIIAEIIQQRMQYLKYISIINMQKRTGTHEACYV